MRTRFLLISLILLAALQIDCATTTPLLRDPEIRAVRPRVLGIDFGGITLAFDVDVYNPNFYPIRSPRLRYNFNVEGARLFGAETTAPINLPQNQVGMVTFPVRVSYLDVLRVYQALAYATQADYALDGGLLFPIAGRTMELPFSYRGTFPILRPPTFSDVNVHVADVSPLTTRIDVTALAKNPNDFPLGLGALQYILKLGDIHVADLSSRTGQTLDPLQTAPLSFTAEVSTAGALLSLLQGSSLGQAKLLPSGAVQTPYGAIPLR